MSQDEIISQSEPYAIELRKFDPDKLEDYRSDDNYDYDAYTQVEKGAFQRLIDRIRNWFSRLFNSGTTGKILEYIMYGILAAAVILFVFRLFGIEANALFKPGKKSGQNFDITEEALDQINFPEEIQKAEVNREWRIAIRLIYLYSLKGMADYEMIEIRRGKTNQDYLYEIQNVHLRDEFAALSFVFEYTWYGHFEASEKLVEGAKGHLSAIQNQHLAA